MRYLAFFVEYILDALEEHATLEPDRSSALLFLSRRLQLLFDVQ
jgi:hypothetical protein